MSQRPYLVAPTNRRQSPALVGDVCAIGFSVDKWGDGTYRLDRVKALTGTAFAAQINAVESSTPVTLNGPSDGRPRWRTYVLWRHGWLLRTDEMWTEYEVLGRPEWRTADEIRSFVLRFMERWDRAAA